MRTAAIVPAAGSGKRLGLKLKKPFVLLNGVPIVIRTLKALDSCREIDSIIVAVDRRSVVRLKDLIKAYKVKKVSDVIIGGRTRFESVKNCLNKIDPSFDAVLIHDGARPLVERSLITKSIDLAKKFGACITALPESDTVKLVDDNMFIKKTLDRKNIFRAQTPQVFLYDLIKKAYGLKGEDVFTDDSALLEGMGNKVKVLKGSCRNIKITTKEDLKTAEVILCG